MEMLMTTEERAGRNYLAIINDQKRRGMKRTAVITEGFGDITTLVGPVSNGDSPSFRVGISILNILGDLVTFEPPKRDLSLVPEHSDDTATSRIEWSTSAAFKIGNGTTGVVTARALAVEAKGVSKVTLWLRAVLVLVPNGDIGI